MGPKAKKTRAFWKKHPELQRITDHIGKFVDRLDGKDVIDLALASFIAYSGARTGYRLTRTVEGAISGAGTHLLGLKLATTQGGTPPVSQIAGLAILGVGGLAAISDALTGLVETVPAEPTTEAERTIIGKLQEGIELTPDEEAYLKQRAMQRWVLG